MQGYQKPKTDWSGADKVRNTDFNRIESNTAIGMERFNGITVFNIDGSIVTTFEDGTTLTVVFNDDGSIVETMRTSANIVIDTKTTIFNADGSITEGVV